KLAHGRLLLQVHDELLFEIPAEFADDAMAQIKQVMEQAVTLSVPLSVDISKGQNWDAVH
ncbi:MAG: DNA polymerase, partial [Alphaproteobacteria bacterium]|nr:DNA polymerase [Alphaproteobacteria bacterium]